MSESEEEEAQFDDEDDDMPLASLKKKESKSSPKKKKESKSSPSGSRESPKRKRKEVNYAVDEEEEEEEEEAEFDEEEEEEEEEDDDDEDDDIPLSALKRSPSKTKAKPKAKAKVAPAKKKAKKSTSASKAPAPATVTKSTDYLNPSSALYDSGSKKGMLIQKLLCRWWYATTWPDPAKLPEKPPKHYDKLDGFEGVYICTSGDKVGHILDKRDEENRPCFENYAKKPAKELQDMLLKALEEQKRQLIAAEGAGTPTEKEIDDAIKWVNKKVNPDTADKEAAKVLKAAKLKL